MAQTYGKFPFLFFCFFLQILLIEGTIFFVNKIAKFCLPIPIVDLFNRYDTGWILEFVPRFVYPFLLLIKI